MKFVQKYGLLLTGVMGVCAAAVTPQAIAFGTVKAFGQDAEHSRITRRALGCSSEASPEYCFEQETLDSLAGKNGGFGAVGAPDRSVSVFLSYAHCSAGDYLDIPDYPRTLEDARKSLTRCREDMSGHMHKAVEAAGRLLDAEDNIRPGQTAETVGCVYAFSGKGRAKCRVLKHFGLVLHASQDFYAHSNWTDQSDQDQPVSIQNPPGLGQRGKAEWLDLRLENPEFPDGLISACGDVDTRFEKNGGCRGRISHGALNKDKGAIDPVIGAGTTPRGAINENFRHAVEAAIEDSADKWLTLQERLVAAYGEKRALKMICVITSDQPVSACA